jgi:hypothetical protein
MKMIIQSRILPFVFGLAMSINFACFWAVPIAGMGLLWKHLFKALLMPIYEAIDENKTCRWFATTYIYAKPEHADFFAISVLLLLNSAVTLGTVFWWQLSTGSLPAWLVFAYFCSWVGIGGRIMGGAYAMAHKEVNQPMNVLSPLFFSILPRLLRFCA